MDFKIKKKVNPNIDKYRKHDIDLAYDFTKKLYKEFGDFLKAVVLFGSTVRNKGEKQHDIDILVIVDDTSVFIGEDVTEAYRIITEKLIASVSTKIHVTTIKFTSFWNYMRAGDPIGINILRDGLPLIDKGFFAPMQVMLYQGRIRPTYEAIWTYFEQAPKTLDNSKWHIMQATLDLYWAVIDSAHAALMRKNEVPPTPEHVADILDRVYVKHRLLEKKYVDTMRKFYVLSKKITHREIKTISGQEYERYYQEAEAFVRRMKQLVEKGKF